MPEVWIGLVGATALEGNVCLQGAKGAYVIALAFVSTVEEYYQHVTDALKEEFQLFAFEFDDIERFGERSARMVLDDRLCALAEETRQSGEVRFHEFHTFANLDG